MTKKTKLFMVVAMACIILSCVVVGRVTANSFVDETDLDEYLSQKNPKICYCEMGYDEDTNVGFVNGDKIQAISDMMKEDTEVARVRLKKEVKRSIYYECVLSSVEIEEVYQGSLEQGDVISVFEPVDCRETEIDCTDGYSLMQEEEEYILFLKPLKNAGYGDGKYVYAPVSTTYAKYLCSDSLPNLFTEEELENPDTMFSYSECKDDEVYLHNQEMYEKYCKLKKQTMELMQ